MFIHNFKALVITSNSIVNIPSLKLFTKLFILFPNIPVQMLLAPEPDLTHKLTHFLAFRLAFDHPMSSTCFSPVMSKSKKIECAIPSA